MSMPDRRRLCLAVLLHGGRFSWRHAAARSEGELDLAMYLDMARTAERGGFDVLFMADSYSIKDDGLTAGAAAALSTVSHFEPMTLLGALATATRHIGLVCTVSTTYSHPYELARRMATLDHLSGGRAGWNVITSQMTSEALNHDLDAQLCNADRYARAREFLDVAFRLWDSWDDDAFPRDKAGGRYNDPSRMHVLDHRGRFFKVRGPLNIARMPQGHPVICQAGESEAGLELAAEHANMMYSKAGSLAHAQEFYARVKGKMAKYGRRPDQLKIMTGLMCVPGRTQEEAQDRYRAVQEAIGAADARAFAVQFMGPEFDLPQLDGDAPLPELAPLEAILHAKRISIVQDGRRLSLVELGRWLAACMGHLTLIGTPAQIADTLQAYLEQDGCDGFALMPHYLPGNLDDFVELVVPELRRRGLMRDAYAEGTLRDRLGLDRPAGRIEARTAGAA